MNPAAASYTQVLREMAFESQRACLLIHRLAAGVNSRIQAVLGDSEKLTVIVGYVYRMNSVRLDRMVRQRATPGTKTPPATFADVERINVAANAAAIKKELTE